MAVDQNDTGFGLHLDAHTVQASPKTLRTEGNQSMICKTPVVFPRFRARGRGDLSQ